MIDHKILPFFFLSLLTCLTPLWAQNKVFNDLLGVRAQAFGGAYRAVASGNDALYYNPAGMAFSRRYNLDADYIYHPISTAHWTGLSLVDSTTSALAAGLDVHVGIDATQKPLNLTWLGSFSLAYPIADIFSLGVTLRYVYLSNQTTSNGDHKVTGDIGLMLQLPFGLSFAAVGYNLLPTQTTELPLSVGFGAAFHLGAESSIASSPALAFKGFTLAVDYLLKGLLSDKTMQHQIAIGGEYYIADIVPIRLGYEWGITEKRHVLSAGLGVFFQVIEIEALFEQNLVDFNQRTFGAGLRVFFL